MLGSQRSHCHGTTNSGFVDSGEGVGRKEQHGTWMDEEPEGFKKSCIQEKKKGEASISLYTVQEYQTSV